MGSKREHQETGKGKDILKSKGNKSKTRQIKIHQGKNPYSRENMEQSEEITET